MQPERQQCSLERQSSRSVATRGAANLHSAHARREAAGGVEADDADAAARAPVATILRRPELASGQRDVDTGALV